MWQETYRGMCERWQQTGRPIKKRLHYGATGAAILFAFGYLLPIHFFVEGGWVRGYRSGGRVDLGLYSSSILSTTLLLFTSAVAGAECVLGPLMLLLSFCRIQSPKSIWSE
jgi:hypothetical protein